MTKVLDRSRPFGTVHPPYQGAHFEQGGFHFDAEGKLVEGLLTREQKEALAKKPPPRPQPIPPAGQSGDNDPPPPPPPGDDDDGVNLEQWLRDEATAKFKDVRQAVKDRYHTWLTAKPAVVIFLVREEKLVEEENVDANLRSLLPSLEKKAS